MDSKVCAYLNKYKLNSKLLLVSDKYLVKFKDGIEYFASKARIGCFDKNRPPDVGAIVPVRWLDGRFYSAAILGTPSKFII